MTTYLLKSILCSALFLLGYWLIFQKEKTLHFNRFYLIISLLASLGIPFSTIEIGQETPIATAEKVFVPIQHFTQVLVQPQAVSTVEIVEENFSWESLFMLIYYLVMGALLVRFLKNIFILFQEINKSEKVVLETMTIVLLERKMIPHSFMNYIFLNKTEYQNGVIEDEILLHESTHVRQRHSLDIIGLELMSIVFWFNPVLIFYKKAIQLNHEFLADEAVLNTYQNTANYQYLLIEKASQLNSFSFTSSFNFSITKQRLIMMTKSTSRTKAMLLTLTFVPLFLGAIALFSTKTIAQKETPITTKVTATKNGVSDKLLAEYKAIIEKHRGALTQKSIWLDKIFTKEERFYLQKIFLAMNKEQQEEQTIVFIKLKPFNKIVPTEKEFEAFKDSKKYGVWIDWKKVENSELNKYKPTDFSQFGISKLFGKAKVGRIYGYQLNMLTVAGYDKHQKETLADTNYYIMPNFKKPLFKK
jgi:bla regulator protein blaR1